MLEWYLREEDADQFVKDFYLIYFSLLALPEDVVAITGLVSSGMKSLPALSRLLKETSTVERGTSNFAKSQLKYITSLESQITIHIEKLKAYKVDSWKFDNLGHLKNAPNDAVREKIIQSRISHLEKEIQIFQYNIKKNSL